ncbi:MAG: PDC sensor domain-containing protein [Burkholderiaceae bacterium]|nr:PDC sensor domain-containing protein [Burkholderiaceae bacterium]
MARLLGEQQLSVVTAVAKEINDNLIDRQQALENIAKQMDADLIGNPQALQTLLEQRPLLPLLFNAGAWVAGPDGTAIASWPHSANRLGAYSTPWRTRFHADGGRCSSVMADSVPR